MSLRVSLVHSCFEQHLGHPRPEKCRCKFRVTLDEAKKYVEEGKASWLVVDWKKDSEGVSIPVTSWNLVWGSEPAENGIVRSALAMKTPRVQTVEKAHIERAYIDKKQDDIDRIEMWGDLAQKVITDLIVPFIPDPYGHGRPILVNFNDERSAKGKDIIRTDLTVKIRVDKTESVA